MTMDAEGPTASTAAGLSAVLIPLLKGVTYRDDDAAHWSALLQLQGRVRDHVAVLGLELMLDEAEGYAFLRSRPDPEDEVRPSCRAWWRGGRCRSRSACCWRCCVKSLPSSTLPAVIHA